MVAVYRLLYRMSVLGARATEVGNEEANEREKERQREAERKRERQRDREAHRNRKRNYVFCINFCGSALVRLTHTH